MKLRVVDFAHLMARLLGKKVVIATVKDLLGTALRMLSSPFSINGLRGGWIGSAVRALTER